MFKKMDPQTEAGYWRARHYYANQLETHRREAYEYKRTALRAAIKNPACVNANDINRAAWAYAEECARSLHERQWRKIEAEFAGYEL